MSGARRFALVAVLVIPLVAAAALLPTDHEREDELGDGPGSIIIGGERTSELPRLRARTAKRVSRSENRREATAARREDADGEPGPTRQALRLYARTRAEAEPVARRFFSAFSRYELGLADEDVERELRATTTRAFAEELRSTPPRIPPGASKPERGFLGRLELVPGEPDASRRRLISGELVGVSHRGGVAQTIAIGLRRSGRGWRVSGLDG